MNDFKWTDELVREFTCELLWMTGVYGAKPKDFSDRGLKSDSLMSNFKQAKQNGGKQKLFTTLDGKDIYEGDEYWLVYIESGSRWKPAKMKVNPGYSYSIGLKSYMKTFSTEELANEYVIMNKPCLNLRDVGAILGGNMAVRVVEEFKKLVNEKINDSNR